MDRVDYTYADFEAAPDPSHRPMYLKKVLASLDGLSPGSKVLDAGCGGGDFSVGLKEAGYDVYGLDMSTSGVEAARARNVGTFKTGSIYEDLRAPFALPHFDAIVAIEVIEHLYSPKAFAARAYEALPPGGVLIISTPYWGYFKNIVLAATNRMDRSLTALWEGGHIKHFSRKTLTELMTNANFETSGFQGAGNGVRKYMPYLWEGMMMTFRKPQ